MLSFITREARAARSLLLFQAVCNRKKYTAVLLFENAYNKMSIQKVWTFLIKLFYRHDISVHRLPAVKECNFGIRKSFREERFQFSRLFIADTFTV